MQFLATSLGFPEKYLISGLGPFPVGHFSPHSSMAPLGGVTEALFTILNFSRLEVGYFGLFTTDEFFRLLLYLPDRKT